MGRITSSWRLRRLLQPQPYQPHIDFVGVGGRAGFNVRSNVDIEAEMAYDFKRNFTTTFSDGVTTQFVSTNLRTLHALFGPKFETSGGPVRFFGTFKGRAD